MWSQGEVLVVHLKCEQIYPQENFSMSFEKGLAWKENIVFQACIFRG